MTSRRDFLQAVTAGGAVHASLGSRAGAEPTPLPATGADDRARWVAVATRMADPLLGALARGELKARMPVEAVAGAEADRRKVTHLEGFGRLLAGLSPWLEQRLPSGDEERSRARLASLAQQGMEAATNPSSPDRMNFTDGAQPLVDAAFLAHAMLRAPRTLWQELPTAT
ncbi:MAG: DUF2264 domain-containing protein, partial [Gemmatimonadales bacterium]|nr:DUF2264 domain-containing protein [Gemmatimonadales bacterium]